MCNRTCFSCMAAKMKVSNPLLESTKMLDPARIVITGSLWPPNADNARAKNTAEIFVTFAPCRDCLLDSDVSIHRNAAGCEDFSVAGAPSPRLPRPPAEPSWLKARLGHHGP